MSTDELPELFLGDRDEMRVFRQGPLWCCQVNRNTLALHAVLGSTVEGVVANSQLALEETDAHLAVQLLDTMLGLLQPLLTDLGTNLQRVPDLIADLSQRWAGVSHLPRREWVISLQGEVQAKLDRLGTPDRLRLLYSGLEWHRTRVAEYHRDLSETLLARSQEAPSE